jgi:hypothetical protein
MGFAVGHLLDAAGREIVNHCDCPAQLHGHFCQLRSDEPRHSRDQCFGHAPSLELSAATIMASPGRTTKLPKAG